jgi:secreted Zn-dependent insulinase-like peptidase
MLLKKINIVSLAHGNIYQEEALSFAGLLKKVLLSSSQPVLVPRSQIIKLANGKNLVRQLNVDHDDSVIAVYFQGADTSFASKAQFSLLAHVLASPFFQELRTERQLGYVVFSSKLSLLEAPGIVFSVQSPTTNPVSLEKHIENFLFNYAKRIAKMSDAVFEDYKSGLLTRVLNKEENLLERSARYWKEINNEYYAFDSREQLAAAIRDITKQDLNRLYHKLLLDESRRRLVVRSFGNKYRKTLVQKTLAEEHGLILNTQEFKKNHETFSG